MTDLRKAAEMALDALDCIYSPLHVREINKVGKAMAALRQALAQPEQEPLGSEWVPCVKLPVIVHVRNQRDGETHISTREGITPVLPEDLIMRGVAGEEYPIGRELFERTYTFDVDAINMSEERVDETDKREQEPWVKTYCGGKPNYCATQDTTQDTTQVTGDVDAVNMSQERVDETAKGEQEPVGFFSINDYGNWEENESGYGTPLYTAPPISDREWVGLTDEEIYDYADKFLYQHGSNYGIRSFGKAIEAKLKEKNT